MNNGIAILVFSLGAAAGAVVTWRVLKTKYDKLVREEIESVKEVYSRKRNEIKPEPSDENTDDKNPEEVDEYKNLAGRYGRESSIEKDDKKIDEKEFDQKPYVITPEDYGQLDDYEVLSLTYYEGNGVLTDDADDPMEDEDIEYFVGYDSFKHFGEYADDSVYVRNDKLKRDYEILLVHDSYSGD